MGVDMAADVGGGAAVASIAGRRLIASFRLSAADTMRCYEKPHELLR
jgi:hypothetical protein